MTDADVTIRSDHLPLKKFLNKQNMHPKVNNWAVELEQFRLYLEWISASRNLLAESLSCLIDVIPDAQQPHEYKDHEFGSYCFTELEIAKVMEVVSTEVIEMKAITSEDVECSVKLRESPEVRGISLSYKGKSLKERGLHADGSYSSESSLNSWISPEVVTFENLLSGGTTTNYSESTYSRAVPTERYESVECSWDSRDQQWCDISEVIESDFLISPGDIYPNRKVQLEDADIKKTTKVTFELLCEQQHEAFSKNNKDIGHTQLIEMEIDTGDSLPVAQSPYRLP